MTESNSQPFLSERQSAILPIWIVPNDIERWIFVVQ
jgi:hypothetical protein